MLAVDGLRALARRAEHYGVVLSVEPLNRYRTSVANTAGQVLRMVEEVAEAKASAAQPSWKVSKVDIPSLKASATLLYSSTFP